MLTIGNLKIILASVLIIGAVWFYGSWKFNKSEKERYEQNEINKERFDSLRISNTVLNDKRFDEYLHINKELTSQIKENGIKLSRVQSILNTITTYRDTTIVKTDLSEVLTAINDKKPLAVPFTDSTKCLTVKGFVKYDNGILALNVTDRIFFGETTVIGFWERRQWSFLGIKTRLLGKKEMTAKVVDKCGDSQTIHVEKLTKSK